MPETPEASGFEGAAKLHLKQQKLAELLGYGLFAKVPIEPNNPPAFWKEILVDPLSADNVSDPQPHA